MSSGEIVKNSEKGSRNESRPFGNPNPLEEEVIVVKKSAYTESDRRYYQKNKERCLELSRPHKKAYWLAHKDELKAKRREYYETVEKPKRLAKKLESSGDKIDEFGV
jgi:hypothetical protein